MSPVLDVTVHQHNTEHPECSQKFPRGAIRDREVGRSIRCNDQMLQASEHHGDRQTNMVHIVVVVDLD